MAERKKETDAQRQERWHKEATEEAEAQLRALAGLFGPKFAGGSQLVPVRDALIACYRMGHAMGRKEVGH